MARPFSGKNSPHKFSDTDPSSRIVSRFTHFEQPFSLQNSKTTYSAPFKPFPLYFIFHPNLYVVALRFLEIFESEKGPRFGNFR